MYICIAKTEPWAKAQNSDLKDGDTVLFNEGTLHGTFIHRLLIGGGLVVKVDEAPEDVEHYVIAE